MVIPRRGSELFHCPLLNFSAAVWVQPERAHLWLRLSGILSMLGNNVLLMPILTVECASILCKCEEQNTLRTDHKSGGGNLSEGAFHCSRMG